MKLDVEGNWFTGYRVDIRDAFVALEARDMGTLLRAVPVEKLSKALEHDAELKIGHNCVSGWQDYIEEDYDGRVEGYPYSDFEDLPMKEHAELIAAFDKVSKYLAGML